MSKNTSPRLTPWAFCFPATRPGYSRDALHQYPCHIVVEHV
nr:MAG TPA: hypothetical protein [Caudoviricetes sp.]